MSASASWSAADSFRQAMDVPTPSSAFVDFPTRGLPRVLGAGNVYVRAEYVSPRWGRIRNIAPHSYAVAPGREAVATTYISGTVFLGSSFNPIPDALVEIIEGEGAGKTANAIINGSYMIEFLRLNQSLTARASKQGYTSDVKSHSGIVDSSNGYPDPATRILHFNLSLISAADQSKDSYSQIEGRAKLFERRERRVRRTNAPSLALRSD